MDVAQLKSHSMNNDVYRPFGLAILLLPSNEHHFIPHDTFDDIFQMYPPNLEYLSL